MRLQDAGRKHGATQQSKVTNRDAAAQQCVERGKEKTHNVKQGDAEGRSVGHRGTASGMGYHPKRAPLKTIAPYTLHAYNKDIKTLQRGLQKGIVNAKYHTNKSG